MQIDFWPIERVIPYDHNPRQNDQAVDAVVASLKEFGFRQPIVVDRDGVIVVGHTRWKAAKKLGLAQVPVHVADLTPEQAKAYRLADNQTATIAEWDKELLPLELADLKEANFDLSLLGFSEDDLAKWLQSVQEGLCDPDDVPAPPDEATTKPGDLIRLGNHRLLCGDSSKPEDVDRLLDGATIHLVNTDPPYNVKVEPRSNNAIAAGLSSFTSTHHQGIDLARHPGKSKPTRKKLRAKDRPLANDFVSDEAFDRMLHAWFGNMARVLDPGRTFYIWGGYANLGHYPPVLKACGLYFSQGVVWDKQHPVLTRKDMMGSFELAFYGWKEGAGHKFFGPGNARDLWQVKKVNPQSMVHLTEKPVELAVRAMQYSSREGENVLDLFGDSGSTLIAAEQTGRKAFLMELDPLYCDVIVSRFETFTGKKAERITEVPARPVRSSEYDGSTCCPFGANAVPRRYRFLAWIVPLLLLNWLLLAVVPQAPAGNLVKSLAIQALGGTIFGQTAVAAAWTAFGPTPFSWRLPLSLAWLAMITLANAINGWLNNGTKDEYVLVGLLLLCQWLLLQIPLWCIAIGFGVHLRHADETEGGEHPTHRQFGIRQLMLVTAVVGVLLGVGRITIPYLFKEVWLFPIVASVIAFLVVAEAVMTLPLVVAALLRRHTGIGVLLALVLFGALTACEVPLLNLVNTAGSSQVQEIIAVNIGTATATLALLAIVRLSGYSLVTSRGKC